ncbi:PREDICTED: sarcocystatin-A-like [Drosophila arizonae]|uniref:Sarcocystatin-A-like n=1 Tax=Drosophila arizonae TaxID=7263 RepID=A0ABM1Q4T8_DROAR|nr:PREDICTED: sarcocystatin-A-like [Drosophila arizonae]
MLTMKIIFILGLALTIVSATIPGGVTELSGADLKEAEDALNNSLSKLASGDGPNYKLGKIIKVTRQVVAGYRYVYDVELIEGSKTKVCNVQIWSQPWLENGIEVTFNCPDGQVVRKHSA